MGQVVKVLEQHLSSTIETLELLPHSGGSLSSCSDTQDFLWPQQMSPFRHLRHLTMNRWHPAEPPPGSSFKSLEILAQTCSELESLLLLSESAPRSSWVCLDDLFWITESFPKLIMLRVSMKPEDLEDLGEPVKQASALKGLWINIRFSGPDITVEQYFFETFPRLVQLWFPVNNRILLERVWRDGFDEIGFA